MSRNRRSAKQAGTRFERDIADYLNGVVDDHIDRRPKTGNRDKGDIANVRAHSQRVVVECKDTAGKYAGELAGWLAEAEVERINDGALAGVVIAKRRGISDPAQQYVITTVGDLVALLIGERPE